MLPIFIVDTSFPKAWERAVRTVVKYGTPLSFGDKREKKEALNSQICFSLDEHAVHEILQLTHHPSDPFVSEGRMKEYINEYSKGYDASKFEYTYRDRLERGFVINDYNTGIVNNLNQLELLRNGLEEQIKSGISSNRNVAVLYNPSIDYNRAVTPCWNHVSVQLTGKDEVSFYTLFRSHDLFTAWEPNMMAITRMLDEEVVKPNKCHITNICEFNYSLHIYQYDIPAAKVIKTVNRHPSLIPLQRKYDTMGGF